MRKIYFLLLSAIVALTACNKEDVTTSSDGELFKLNVATESVVQTRAVDPVVPIGFKLRYILEIYNRNSLNNSSILYKRLVQDTPGMEFRLVTNQAYDFLIWVDYVAVGGLEDLHYTTTNGLKAIELKSNLTNNNVTRDAFFYTFSKTKDEVGNTANDFQTVICKRPFGQLNVTTTDWDLTKGIDAITPDKVKISFTAYKMFDVYSGEASEATMLSYVVNQDFADAVSADGTSRHLTCDYIIAPKTGEYILPDTKVEVYKNGVVPAMTDTDQMLINLPIKRNYKTNVSGRLFSKSGSITVDVKAEWDDDSPLTVPITDPQP